MTGDSAERIRHAISSERLAPYLRAAAGNLGSAILLYEWNLAISGALYEVLGVVEVVLRNAMNTQLDRNAPHGSWYDDPQGLLSEFARRDIASARDRITRLERRETPGRVVAELNFGFWKFLLAGRYEATLWTGSLRHAFPNLQPQRRATVYEALDSLHTLRNRIAHHEPIHRRNLATDLTTIDRLLDWIDPEVRSWTSTLSRAVPVLAARPNVPTG